MILLVGAGLLLRSLINLQSTNLGYSREKLLVLQVDGASSGHDGEERMLFYRRIFEKFNAIPGIRKVAFSKLGLFSGGESNDDIAVEGYTPQGKKDRDSAWDEVGPSYFSVLGITVTLGREINDRDQLGASAVCVVNESFRKLFFAASNPIGKHLTAVYGDKKIILEVVGSLPIRATILSVGDALPAFLCLPRNTRLVTSLVLWSSKYVRQPTRFP